MVKTHFLFIILVTSGFLLTIQLIALQFLLKQATIEEPPSWKILDSITDAAQQYSIPLFLIDQLLLQYIHNGTTADFGQKSRDRLQYIYGIDDKFYKHSSIGDPKCKVFCNSHSKITHLATLADFLTQESISQLATYLDQHNRLTVIALSDSDPTLEHLNLHVTIPTHLIVIDEDVDIRKESHVVHITILHERIRGNYWWRGPLRLTEHHERLLHRQGLKRSEIRQPYSNAIYTKTEIIRTTIDGLPIYLPVPSASFLVPTEEKKFLECNLKRSLEFYSEFPKEDTVEANRFRSKAQTLLTKVRHLLEEELNISFWLSSGTLLGYYRQCDFIVYSGDVDIAMWADDFRPELIDVFSNANLPLIHQFGLVNDSFELSFLSGDLKLDIFFFYRESEHYWNGGTQARTGLKFKYLFPRFTLCWTEFVGILLRVPCQTEAYIEANYGKDWMRPVKSWDWKSSPPNVKPNGQWDPADWRETIRLIPIPIF